MSDGTWRKKLRIIAAVVIIVPLVLLLAVYLWARNIDTGFAEVAVEVEREVVAADLNILQKRDPRFAALAAGVADSATTIAAAAVVPPNPLPRRLEVALLLLEGSFHETTEVVPPGFPLEQVTSDFSAYSRGRLVNYLVHLKMDKQKRLNEAINYDTFGEELHQGLDAIEERMLAGVRRTSLPEALCIVRACLREDDELARKLLRAWLAGTVEDQSLLVDGMALQRGYPTSVSRQAMLLLMLAEVPHLPEGFLEEYELALRLAVPDTTDFALREKEDVLRRVAVAKSFGRNSSSPGSPKLLYIDGVASDMANGLMRPVADRQLERLAMAWMDGDMDTAFDAVRTMESLPSVSRRYLLEFFQVAMRRPVSREELKWIHDRYHIRPARADVDMLRLLAVSVDAYRSSGQWPTTYEDALPADEQFRSTTSTVRWQIERGEEVASFYVAAGQLKEHPSLLAFERAAGRKPRTMDELRPFISNNQEFATLSAEFVYLPPHPIILQVVKDGFRHQQAALVFSVLYGSDHGPATEEVIASDKLLCLRLMCPILMPDEVLGDLLRE